MSLLTMALEWVMTVACQTSPNWLETGEIVVSGVVLDSQLGMGTNIEINCILLWSPGPGQTLAAIVSATREQMVPGIQ
jgi:hypothetical protein